MKQPLDLVLPGAIHDAQFEKINGGLVADQPVLQEIAEDLGKVGLARAKEAGDPHPDAIGLPCAGFDVALQELDEQFLDSIGDDVLPQFLFHLFEAQVVHRDDGGNIALDGINEEILDLGHGLYSPGSILGVRAIGVLQAQKP